MNRLFSKWWQKKSGGARLLFGVLGVCVVVGIWYGYREWKEARDFVPQDFNTFMEVPRTDREVANYTKFMEQAYRNDVYGGATPEETLKLFTDALKAGDTELAAKYFVVEKQVGRKEVFDNWKKIDRLEFVASSLTHYGKTAYPLENNAQINLIIDNKPSVTVFLVKNTQTNKWKIESL
ncbi:MAG: hypothetical protein RLZZ347_415 [Candidatus Parcubacteria bacterium]|jgi:hypothetical protein